MSKKPLNGRDWERKSVEPYPEELMKKMENINTICGVLREIYRKTSNDEVKLLSRTAVSMAKKMASRLKYYYDRSIG